MSELYHFNPYHDKIGRFTFSRYRNPDGSLNERGLQREARKLEKKDTRWAKRNYNKLYKKAYKPAKKELNQYVKRELNPKYSQQLRSGKISKSFMNEYNRKLVELMNQNVNNLPTAPSGRVVKFIAKRGELGAHMALADAGYNMNQFRSGIYGSGRVAYRKTHIDMV